MWCELVVLPTSSLYGGGPQPGSVVAPATLTAPMTSPFTLYSSAPAFTGVPLNKVSIQSPITPAQTPQIALAQNGKLDTTDHYHVFVGDLAPEIENHHLRDVFSVFGNVTDCKIIKDMHTQRPKGYGFVSYATRIEAEDSIQKMNGQLLGSRAIRTNWAVRKPPQPPDQRPLDFNEINNASSASNTTVYVGGITHGLTEELLKDAFGHFGNIYEIRLFKDKGYAFLRFDSHEAATRSIITMHGKEVGNQLCKCSWGKECNDSKDMQISPLSQFHLYGSPLGYPVVNPAASQSAAAAVLNYIQANPITFANYTDNITKSAQSVNPMNAFGLINNFSTINSIQNFGSGIF